MSRFTTFLSVRVWAVLAACVISVVGFFPEAVSYVRTAANHGGKRMENAIPLSLMIDRAEQMSADLMTNVEPAKRTEIATAVVESQQAEETYRKNKDNYAAELKQLRQLEEALSKGGICTFGGRKYTPQEISADLDRRVAAAKKSEAALELDRARRDAAADRLSCVQAELTQLIAERTEVDIKIIDLKKRYLKSESIVPGMPAVDPGDLAALLKLLDQIEVRVRVQEQRRSMTVDRQPGLIPVNEQKVDRAAEIDGLIQRAQ